MTVCLTKQSIRNREINWSIAISPPSVPGGIGRILGDFFDFVIFENITLLIFFKHNVNTTFYIKISWKENSTVFYQRNNAANRIKISFNLLINNQITILSVFNFQRFWIQVDDLVITKAGSWLFLCMYYFTFYLIFNCTDNRYIFELYFTNLMHSFN